MGRNVLLFKSDSGLRVEEDGRRVGAGAYARR
jgi:hypothetical protein